MGALEGMTMPRSLHLGGFDEEERCPCLFVASDDQKRLQSVAVVG
jgi:hypothetical protein